MKKTFRFVGLMIILMSVCLTSCGGDDDVSGNGNGSSVQDKHITMIEYQSGDEHIILNINYDIKGRIISAYKNTTSPNQYTIEYTDNMIKYSIFNYIEYSLLDNHVVSARNSYKYNYGYSYNNNNIISCTETGDNYTNRFDYTWSNGNITKITQNNKDDISIEYTNYKWPTNYVFLYIFFEFGSVTSGAYGIPWILMQEGYCGNRPKNLPHKIGTSEYTYTMDDGYPIKVNIKSSTTDGRTLEAIYNLIWN